jgi:glycosyltransferase involved in cell wall biosynthesis
MFGISPIYKFSKDFNFEHEVKMTDQNTKISIIVPVYNEEKIIGECIEALQNLDYPKSNYEIIVVDDGSTDKTSQEIKKAGQTPIISGINNGRIKARIIGAMAAKHDILLFVDSRIIVPRNLLMTLININYQPVITPNDFQSAHSNPYEKILDLIRLKYYKKNVSQITQDNFDRVGKGTSCLLISKKLFLECQPIKKSKNTSDDTKIFKEVVKKKHIFITPQTRVRYIPREKAGKSLLHLFQRGPKFQDYYLSKEGVYYKHWIFLLLMLFFSLFLLIAKPNLIFYYLGFFTFLMLIFSVYLSKNFLDFILCVIYLPQIIIVFGFGIIYGKILNLFDLVKKNEK